MKLLALDTSSLACSVALQLGDAVICRHEEQAREHTRLLVPMIKDVLGEGGITPSDLDAIVLGNGPGSFIGMRIATSVAQGLAHGADIQIVPVSSMLAVAAQVVETEAAGAVAVCQDAHMDEVYLGLFEAGSSRVPICPPATPPTRSETSRDQSAVACGGQSHQPSFRPILAGGRIRARRIRRGDRSAGRSPRLSSPEGGATCQATRFVTVL